MTSRSAWLALLIALSACHRGEPPPAPAKAAALDPEGATTGGAGGALRSPLPPSELPTTDGAIAIHNLEAQIAANETTLTSHPGNLIAERNLVPLYLSRGQFLGRLADYERAQELAERIVQQAAHEASSYELRASVRSTFHRFDEALADLDELDRLRGGVPASLGQRAAIWQATGRYPEALRVRRAQVERSPSVLTLGALASLLGEMGDVDAADEQFARAQHQLHAVSPLPLAWL
jgi:tetratricopeptide (TPR) repeat protein